MHVELSLYFIFCTMCSVFYPHGAMTTVLLLTLLAIHQYVYHLLLVDSHSGENLSYCTECQTMTTNSYIHCNQCEVCYPAFYIHKKMFNRCVDREILKRYVMVVKMQLALNILLSIMQCIVYPPFCIVAITTVISSKSILSKL